MVGRILVGQRSKRACPTLSLTPLALPMLYRSNILRLASAKALPIRANVFAQPR